jgi:hypothetical protein
VRANAPFSAATVASPHLTTAAVSTSLPTMTATSALQTASATPASAAPDVSPTGSSTPSGDAPDSRFPTAPLPLSAFPRPPDDNGLGVHWSTHLYAQSDEATSYFVSELARMNVRWVKLINDGVKGRDYDDTIDDLVGRGIMPILRLYQRCNKPYDPSELRQIVEHYTKHGVYYYELYNEPNLPGKAGGWCQEGGTPQPEYLAAVWADAARVIYLAGGYPSLPSLFAPSKKRPDWRADFFYRFFDAVRAQGNTSVLYFAWAPIHNYNINHPPDYPFDDVNLTGRPLTSAEIERYDLSPEQVAQINHARATAREPGGYYVGDNLADDSTCFLHFIAWRDQFYDLFGFEIPLISTEGGATRGSGEDPRYPVVDGLTVAEWTLEQTDYMLDRAPDYYFATMTWLLAQRALDYPEPNWEINAWYHDRAGDQEPVVEALKNRPRLRATRQPLGQ